MVCRVIKRTMKRYEVTFRKQPVKLHIFNKIKTFIAISVIRNNLHSKAIAYTAHCSPNFTCANNSRSFSMKRYPCKPLQTEIILSYLNIRFMNPSLCSKCKSHGKLCNSFRRIPWHPHYSNTKPVSRININIVVSCTPLSSHLNQLPYTQ